MAYSSSKFCFLQQLSSCSKCHHLVYSFAGRCWLWSGCCLLLWSQHYSAIRIVPGYFRAWFLAVLVVFLPSISNVEFSVYCNKWILSDQTGLQWCATMLILCSNKPLRVSCPQCCRHLPGLSLSQLTTIGDRILSCASCHGAIFPLNSQSHKTWWSSNT